MIYSQDPYSDDSLRRVCVLMLFLGILNLLLRVGMSAVSCNVAGLHTDKGGTRTGIIFANHQPARGMSQESKLFCLDKMKKPGASRNFHIPAPILGTRMDFPETTVKNKNPPLFWPGIHSNMRQDHQTRGFAEAHGFHTLLLSMFWLAEFNSGLP